MPLVIQRANGPMVLLNLPPEAAIGYARFNYGAVMVGTTLPTQANDARIGQLTARFNF